MTARLLYSLIFFIITLCSIDAQFQRKCPNLIEPKYVPAGCDWQIITVRSCNWFNLTCSIETDVSCFAPKHISCSKKYSSFFFNSFTGECELAENAECADDSVGKFLGFPSEEDCTRFCSPPNVLPFTATVNLTSTSTNGTLTSTEKTTERTASETFSPTVNATDATTTTVRAQENRVIAHNVAKLELCRLGFNSSGGCETPEQRVFFNRTDGMCQISHEPVCKSEQNFESVDICLATCKDIEPCPVYEVPPKKENCRLLFIDGEDFCPEPQEACNATATKQSLTTEERRMQTCRTYEVNEDADCKTKSEQIYYYDMFRAVCVKKVVCSKADGLFRSKEECNEMCSSVPPCPIYAPPIVEPGCVIATGGLDQNFCPSPPTVNCSFSVESVENIVTTTIATNGKGKSVPQTAASSDEKSNTTQPRSSKVSKKIPSASTITPSTTLEPVENIVTTTIVTNGKEKSVPLTAASSDESRNATQVSSSKVSKKIKSASTTTPSTTLSTVAKPEIRKVK